MLGKHLDFLAYWLLDRIPPRPWEIRIEVTNKCNLKCVFCDREAMKRKVQNMDLRLFDKICREAVSFGIPIIGLNRFGEPTLNPDLPDMVAIAKGHKAKRVEFATNATTLTEALSAKLIAAGLDRIEFSIDSSTPKLYNELRVGADFARTQENIMTFLRLNHRAGNKVKTFVSFICMSQNASQMKGYKAYWKDKVDGIIFYPFAGYGNLAKLHATTPFGRERQKCLLLYYIMSAYSNGMAGLCCAGDPNATISTVDLNTHTVEQAWNSLQANRIRDIHIKKDLSKLPICMNCDMTLPYSNWIIHKAWCAYKTLF